MSSTRIPTTLIGDVTRVRQVLVNLVGNAVKFTDTGEVVVSVAAQPIDPAGQLHELHFSVRDTGLGIPADRMDRLFHSFSQVDASTTRRCGGTELGLAISKRLAEIMGGQMWAVSEGVPVKGSTFHSTIKVEAAPNQKRTYLRGVEPQLMGKRLLIVDDNATNRLILRQQAEAWEILPRVAASGPEALEWIRQGDAFDESILDMQMPDIDGLMLANEIRRYRDAQSLPLVMLTSIDHWDQASTGLFAAFLNKLVKPAQLHKVLSSIFGDQVEPARRPVDRQPIAARLAARHPLRILLAEDNGVNQKVAPLLLNRMGYQADVAANGQEGLDALFRRIYDVVLMDVHMPELDQLQATRLIRAQ